MQNRYLIHSVKENNSRNLWYGGFGCPRWPSTKHRRVALYPWRRRVRENTWNSTTLVIFSISLFVDTEFIYFLAHQFKLYLFYSFHLFLTVSNLFFSFFTFFHPIHYVCTTYSTIIPTSIKLIWKSYFKMYEKAATITYPIRFCCRHCYRIKR